MAMAGLYRRVLPSPPAIDFASSEGKELFLEAVQNGTMEGFYKLISYFQTQSEPAYCGLASLSMVLNALAIDPGRTWKGPWRWFDESMLDCCEPLEKVKAEGISFQKLECLAHCAGANVQAFGANESSLDEFRNYVRACSKSDECHVITSYHRGIFKQSCKHESWQSVAKYLMEDVPLLLKSQFLMDIEGIISVVCISLPTNFRDFIKWVAEVRRHEDAGQHLSQEEIQRLVLKEELLKQVQETGLYKYVTKFLSSANRCSRKAAKLGCEYSLSDIAASVCCEGAKLLTGQPCSSGGFCCQKTSIKLLTSDGGRPVTVVSGTVMDGESKQGLQLLVPATQSKSVCCFGPGDCAGSHPTGNDVLTVLLLSLPMQTWTGIKNAKLLQELSSLVSDENLPSLLKEEVLHLRRQLILLKRCQDNNVDGDLHTPPV